MPRAPWRRDPTGLRAEAYGDLWSLVALALIDAVLLLLRDSVDPRYADLGRLVAVLTAPFSAGLAIGAAVRVVTRWNNDEAETDPAAGRLFRFALIGLVLVGIGGLILGVLAIREVGWRF